MEQEYKYMVCTVCSTFNHAPYIVDAMNGFTMQETTFPVYYLITDDASTDGEPEVIKQYLAGHFQTPYRIEETDDYYLICANHNTKPNCIFIVFLLKYNHYSIKKSKLPYQSEWRDNAKYIAICEGDDYWTDKYKLQEQVDYMNSHYNCAFVHSHALVLQEPTKRISKQKHGKRFESFEDLLMSNKVVTLTICIRNSAYFKYVKDSSTWPEKQTWKMGDYPCWLWLSHNFEFHFVDKVSGVYRVLPESASHSKNMEITLGFYECSYQIQLFFAKLYSVDDDLIKLIKTKNDINMIQVYCQYNRFLNGYNVARSLPLKKKLYYVLYILLKSVKSVIK